MIVNCHGEDYSIEPLIFSTANLKMFWDRARKFPILFGNELSDDFTKFLNLFLGMTEEGSVFPKGLFWRIDKADYPMVGAFYMTDIEMPVQATVHFSFFDGRVRKRLPLARKMLKYAFNELGINKVNAQMPVYVRPSSINFIKALGFVEEGKTRKTSFYNGEYYDTYLFGILQDEVL